MTKFELPEKPKKTNTSEDFINLRKAVDELDKFDYAWKTYANKADRRINAANMHIEELERENQRLVAENMAVKTLVGNAKSKQALPVVPECVGEWIEILKTKGLKPLKNPETYGETGFTEEKLQNIVFWISENQEDYMRAWLDGFKVEKPQLFYLKHIDMSKVDETHDWFILHHGSLGHSPFCKGELPYYCNTAKFTQSEIDSMETGSYEQIEVTE